MKYRTLGRTGLSVSLLGLGTGGPSRFGQTRGASRDESRALATRALELGVNFFDTAQRYGDSEELLGYALAGVPRDRYVIATKYAYADKSGAIITPSEVAKAIDASLRKLRVDVIDIEQIHGLLPEHVDQVMDSHLPVLEKARDEGKIRFIGATEATSTDHAHVALRQVLAVGRLDTIMIGYNLLHQTAETGILPSAFALNIGTIIMVPVRRVLASPELTRKVVAELKASGQIGADSLPDDDPLGWLLHDGIRSVPEAAYRFAIAHPEIDSVLTGTADIDHLETNVAAVNAGPLGQRDIDRLRRVFGPLAGGIGT